MTYCTQQREAHLSFTLQKSHVYLPYRMRVGLIVFRGKQTINVVSSYYPSDSIVVT